MYVFNLFSCLFLIYNSVIRLYFCKKLVQKNLVMYSFVNFSELFNTFSTFSNYFASNCLYGETDYPNKLIFIPCANPLQMQFVWIFESSCVDLPQVVRGVGAGGIVSTAYCLLYKLFTLKLTRKQVNGLITHPDSPYIRGLGFMYIRYTQPPADLWDWYDEYLEDPEEMDVKAGGGQVMTVGNILKNFLCKLEWFSTLFPRIPVPIQQKLEKKMNERFPPPVPGAVVRKPVPPGRIVPDIEVDKEPKKRGGESEPERKGNSDRNTQHDNRARNSRDRERDFERKAPSKDRDTEKQRFSKDRETDRWDRDGRDHNREHDSLSRDVRRGHSLDRDKEKSRLERDRDREVRDKDRKDRDRDYDRDRRDRSRRDSPTRRREFNEKSRRDRDKESSPRRRDDHDDRLRRERDKDRHRHRR